MTNVLLPLSQLPTLCLGAGQRDVFGDLCGWESFRPKKRVPYAILCLVHDKSPPVAVQEDLTFQPLSLVFPVAYHQTLVNGIVPPGVSETKGQLPTPSPYHFQNIIRD